MNKVGVLFFHEHLAWLAVQHIKHGHVEGRQLALGYGCAEMHLARFQLDAATDSTLLELMAIQEARK